MKYLLGLIVAAVVVVGGYFAFMHGGQNGDTSGTQEAMQQDDSAAMAKEGAFTGSLFDLSKRGGDFVCTFTHNSGVAASTGTVYISGSDIRGDFESQAQGVNVESHMIARADTIYVWSPLAPMGVKLPRVNVEGDGTAAASGEYADYQQAYTYDCKAWTKDESVFEVPPSITFIEPQQ